LAGGASVLAGGGSIHLAVGARVEQDDGDEAALLAVDDAEVPRGGEGPEAFHVTFQRMVREAGLGAVDTILLDCFLDFIPLTLAEAGQRFTEGFGKDKFHSGEMSGFLSDLPVQILEHFLHAGVRSA
jgi:hypothetical protein